MCFFLQGIIIILFILSLVLLKTTPEDSKEYNKTRSAFIISAVLLGMLVAVYVFNFIMDIFLAIWFGKLINDFFAVFL